MSSVPTPRKSLAPTGSPALEAKPVSKPREREQQLQSLANEINQRNEAVRSHLMDIFDEALAIGKAAHEAKSLLPHGDFEDWIEDNCPKAARTIQKYMQLYESREECIEMRQELKAAGESLSLSRALSMLAARRRQGITSKPANDNTHEPISAEPEVAAEVSTGSTSPELISTMRIQLPAAGTQGLQQYVVEQLEEAAVKLEKFAKSAKGYSKVDWPVLRRSLLEFSQQFKQLSDCLEHASSEKDLPN